MSKEAMKLALEALENEKALNDAVGVVVYATDEAVKALEQALAEQHLQDLHDENVRLGLYEQGEPVAWLITDESINSLQVASIQRVIDRLKHAHHTDLCLRINGQDERFEADWIKHLQRATSPPKRQPLTDEQLQNVYLTYYPFIESKGSIEQLTKFARAIELHHGIKE